MMSVYLSILLLVLCVIYCHIEDSLAFWALYLITVVATVVLICIFSLSGGRELIGTALCGMVLISAPLSWVKEPVRLMGMERVTGRYFTLNAIVIILVSIYMSVFMKV